MKMRTVMYWKRILYVMFVAAFLLVATAAARATEAPRISKEDAKALIGSPNVIFVDARINSEWKNSDKKIKGAVRVAGADYEIWATDLDRDTTFVIYCT